MTEEALMSQAYIELNREETAGERLRENRLSVSSIVYAKATDKRT